MYHCTFPNCNRKYQKDLTYLNHVRKVHGDPDPVLPEQREVEQRRAAVKKEITWYICPECSRRYKIKEKYDGHIRRFHPALCDEQGIVAEDPVEKKLLGCHRCNKKFRSQESYELHMAEAHEIADPEPALEIDGNTKPSGPRKTFKQIKLEEAKKRAQEKRREEQRLAEERRRVEEEEMEKFRQKKAGEIARLEEERLQLAQHKLQMEKKRLEVEEEEMEKFRQEKAGEIARLEEERLQLAQHELKMEKERLEVEERRLQFLDENSEMVNICPICLSGNANVISYSCRHLICCKDCLPQFKKCFTKCPMCRARVTEFVEFYG